MVKSDAKINYQDLRNELDDVMNRLQDSGMDVDEALKLYKKGLELVKQLETYLEGAENSVRELKAKFNSTTK